MGKYLKEHLEQFYKYPIVGDVRGMGMILAIELVADRKSKAPIDPKLKVGTWIRDYCWKHGMILRNNGDILVIAPAFTMAEEEADKMLELMEQAICEAIKHFKL